MKKSANLILAFLFTVNFQNLNAGIQNSNRGDNPRSGKITGKVIDKNTNEALIGLTVLIEGTTIGTMTNIDGQYELSNLSPGKYKVVFKLMSYQTKVVGEVQVSEGKATSLNITMQEDIAALQEVVIASTYKQESIGALYSMQKASVSISDGISSDAIKRSPDKNTSEVLRRISGASIQDNKFVIIRGLSDRYNAALINGSPLPGTEPDKRAFSFDLFPSALLDNMTITKTATPDLPGDFAGGVIQLNTRDFPEQDFFNISIGSSYNTIATFKPYYSSQKGGMDYLGFDDGTRDLPQGMPASKEYQSLSKKEQLLISKTFKNDWGYDRHASAAPGKNIQLSFGRKNKVFKNNLGSIFSLTYTNSQRYQQTIRRDFNADSTRMFDYTDDQYTYSVLWGALANVAYQVGDNTKITFKNTYNINADDQTTLRNGINFENDGYVKSYAYQYVSKQLLSSQFSGEHFLPSSKIKLKWVGGYNKTVRDEPDYRRLTYKTASTDLNEDSIYYATVPQSSANNQSGKFYSLLNEKGHSGGMEVLLPFNVLKDKSSVKGGVSWQQRDRDFSARVLGYVLPQFSAKLLTLGPDSIFDPRNIADTTNSAINKGFRIDEITNNSDRYDAEGTLKAGFLMFDNRLVKKLRLVWGMRVESFNQQLNAVDYSLDTIALDTTNVDLLPSVNITWELTPEMNFRAAFSKTVSRPEFRELAPFAFYDFATSALVQGNPSLKRTVIHNYDLRWEFYPGAAQVISVSAFHKVFMDPVEQVIVSGTGGVSRSRTFRNIEKAENYGIEAELRFKLNFMEDLIDSKIWDNLTIYNNYAWIRSKVDLTDIVNVDAQFRPLQGQSPYLVNTGLQYYNPENMLGFGLLYNTIGRRIAEVGADGYKDIYEAPRNLFDVQVSKTFFEKVEARLNISDILAEDRVFYQDDNSSMNYEKDKDHLIQSTSFGTTWSFGLAYRF